jgi:lipid-binding SYLF domain-containing protein
MPDPQTNFVTGGNFGYIQAPNPSFMTDIAPEITMNKLLAVLITLSLLISSAHAQVWKPDVTDKLELSVAQAIIKANETDPTLTMWFESAYAYAVFPKVGKGGFIFGGAHGDGLVIQGGRTVGTTSLTQVTVGAQVGGQTYSQYIMFKDQVSFEHFTRGNFEMGAQVSAVALKVGASVDANYDSGVAVFTLAESGLMAEASIGGQKFEFRAK